MRVWGRIPAAERGRLPHAVPSPRPPELSLDGAGPDTIASLSAAAGNQAVARAVTRGSSPLAIQRNNNGHHDGDDDDMGLTALLEGGEEEEQEEESIWGGLMPQEETSGGPTIPTAPVSSPSPTMAEPKPEPEVPSTGTLRERLEAAFDLEVPVAKLLQAIGTAAPEDRQAAAADEAFVNSLRDRLRKGDYLKVVAALGVKQEGTVAHTPPQEADRLVREKLGEWVAEAAAGGAQITGKIAILTGANWGHAVEQHFKGRYPPSFIEDFKRTLNAFFHDDLVFINGNKGNPGTVIHEAVHKHSKEEELYGLLGKAFNEGITEYFARKVTSPLGIDRQKLYDKELEAAHGFLAIAGEPVLVNAYFHANVRPLKDSFLKFREGKSGSREKAEKDWQTFLLHVKKDDPDEDWGKGIALLQP